MGRHTQEGLAYEQKYDYTPPSPVTLVINSYHLRAKGLRVIQIDHWGDLI